MQGVGELNEAIRVQRQDGIRRAFDDCVVAGVLSLAEHPVAMGGSGDIRNLEQRQNRPRSLPEGTDRHVMDQWQAGPCPQRQQVAVQQVGQKRRGAQPERLSDRCRKAGERAVRKKLFQEVFADGPCRGEFQLAEANQ